jgi:polygalacturonase
MVVRLDKVERSLRLHSVAWALPLFVGFAFLFGCTVTKIHAAAGPPHATMSYVTPQAYGAKGDGVTDDTAAFQSALAAGDLMVPAATYLINKNIYVPSYRNVRCQPGANLHTTRHDGHESGVITFKAVTYSSVMDCTITGSNTATVPMLDDNQWNYLIWVSSSNNIVIMGNTLKNAWANGALRFDAEGNSNTPSTNILVTHNTFLSNGYYGLATISANDVQVMHNYFVDSSCCAEANSPITDQSKFNVYSYNYMTSIHGNGANCTACMSGIFFTGGEAPDNFDYGTVRVYGNYITGKSTRLITGANPGGTPPVYTNNKCINGCKEQ